MVGRTHLQPAMPSSVGLWASAQAESLLDDVIHLIDVYQLNDQCPLGAAASYGVPLPIDRELTSQLLGFSRPIHNVLYAINVRGKLETAILGALGQVMLSLARLAQDLILYSLPEFGCFSFPPEYGTGSSIMPQKNNPDVLELIRARSATVLSLQMNVAEIARSLPSGYNRDLQETKGPLFDGLAITRASVRIMTLLTRGVTVHPERLKAGFTPGVFATDRALELVASGMPFREAYQQVKERLGELETSDPAAALAAKTHLGAPAGLDWEGYAERVQAGRDFVQAERLEFHEAISQLMGLPYPPAN
jgi:argininosuccinate lyase